MQNFELIKVVIDRSYTNNRLDLVLTKIINKYSRSQIKILLQNENVKKSNQIITDASYRVKNGEIFYIKIPIKVESEHKPQNLPLDIIYEDNELLVVNKSPGMVTHPAPGNKDNTLVNALLYYTKKNLSSINDTNKPGIVHRLDKETSGLLVVAKNNIAHLHLAKQFKDHTIIRKYFAIVWGIPKNITVKGLIQRDKKNRKKMIMKNNSNGKYSETSIKLLKSYKICSLIECNLKTGRTHQVRVHLSSINHPLIGDKVYGRNFVNKYKKDKKNYNKYLILKNFNRQALHAFQLSFFHPTTKKELEFKSKQPPDMLKLLEYLSKY